MNFNILKLGFENYLQELQKAEGTNGENENKVEDISIFSHMNEFKDYIEEEYGSFNLDFSIDSMNINDIMNLDFQNGKLINPDELGSEEELNEENTEDTTEKGKSFLAGLLGDLLGSKDVQNIVDTDKDGKYSEDELDNFFTNMTAIDEDKEKLSLNDIFGAAEKINNNEFTVADKTTTEAEDVADVETTQGGSSSGSTGSSGSSGGSFAPSSPSAPSNNTNSSNLLGKDPSTMTIEELEAVSTEAQNQLSTKQSELNATIDGTSPEIQKLQGNVDQAFEDYMTCLESVEEEDETFSKDIKAKKEEIDTQNQTINDNQKAIEGKNSEIDQHKATISAAESSINSLNGTKASLQSALSSEDADTAAIQAQIQYIDSQITELQNVKEEEEQNLATAETEKAELETQQTEAQTQLETLESELTELQNAAEEAHPEIQETRQAYDEAKQTFNTEKSTAVSNAQNEVNAAQTYVNEVDAAITNYDVEQLNKQVMKDSGLAKDEYDEEAGNTVAEAGFKEARRRSSSGLCLAGVSTALKNVYGINLCDKVDSAYMAADLLRGNDKDFEELASHFKEVTTYKKEDLKTLPAGAIVVWDQSIGPHGHISIADGNGNEASDHTQPQAQWDGNFTVFLPISV